MAIQFACACGQQLQIGDEHAGKQTRCPACGREMTVPQPAAFQAADMQLPPRAPAANPETEPRMERRRQLRDMAVSSVQSSTSGMAIASLIMGIFSFCIPALPALLGLLFGILGLVGIGRSEGRLKGKGLAIAGMILSVTGQPRDASILALVGGQPQHTQRLWFVQSKNNMGQIGLAMKQYEATNRTPAACRSPWSGRQTFA